MNAVRAVVRGVGELFVTAGLVLLLFCAYQLVWTNVEAARAQDDVADNITEMWRTPDAGARSAGRDEATAEADEDSAGPDEDSSGQAGSPARRNDNELTLTRADFGKGFAFLRIPRLGENYKVPIVEGVRESHLARGVGHYPRTAGPGQVGNFAVAGHRATNGEPFRALDRLRKGDAVVVETRNTWLTYVVDSSLIVKPSDTWVIQPVPGKPGVEPTQRLLTLTTCHPRWASTHRLVVFAHLDSTQRKSKGVPPALQAAGR